MDKNKAFAKASPAQKRFMIAEDVLEQLDLGIYRAANGVYLGFPMFEENEIAPYKSTQQCKVCAIGSAFVSALRLGNGCDIGNLVANHGGSDQMLTEVESMGAFSPAEMRDMESYFEYGGDDPDDLEWTNYGVLGSEDRLRVIMENVMLNCGKFTGIHGNVKPVGRKAVYKALKNKNRVPA